MKQGSIPNGDADEVRCLSPRPRRECARKSVMRNDLKFQPLMAD